MAPGLSEPDRLSDQDDVDAAIAFAGARQSLISVEAPLRGVGGSFRCGMPARHLDSLSDRSLARRARTGQVLVADAPVPGVGWP